MKKFKTTREKQIAKEESLAHLLAERNLLKTVFLEYLHLPLALAVALGMSALSYMVDQQWQALEQMQYFYLGLGLMGFYFIYQTYDAFQRQRVALKHTLNQFVGQKRYPILFAGISMYLLWPMNLSLLVAGGLILILALLSVKIPFPNARQKSLFSALLAIFCLALPLVPVSFQTNGISYGIWGGLSALILGVSLSKPEWIHHQNSQ